ncbi:hypothetical protein FRC03_000941 [Tulasnella sp. 419]|nr:hypothetical protein FRC03_000941 [Tulasnella sp. 419]
MQSYDSNAHSGRSSSSNSLPGSPLQGTPLIDPFDIRSSFSSNTSTEESGLFSTGNSPADYPQPLPSRACLQPPLPPSRSTTVPRSFSSGSSKSKTMGTWWTAFNRLLFYFFVLALGLIIAIAGSDYYMLPPKPPIDSIAKVASRHATLGVELFRALRKLHECCTWEDMHRTEATALSDMLFSLNADASVDAQVLSDMMYRIGQEMDTPNAYVTIKAFNLHWELAHISQWLEVTLQPGPRNLKIEKRLNYHVDNYLASELPKFLRDLTGILDTAKSRTDNAIAKRQRILDAIKQNQEVLELVKPDTWMWWRKTAWEKNPVVHARHHAINSVIDSWNTLEKYRSLLERSIRALQQYKQTPQIFNTLNLYPKIGSDAEKQVRHYIEKMRSSLQEMDEQVRTARVS